VESNTVSDLCPFCEEVKNLTLIETTEVIPMSDGTKIEVDVRLFICPDCKNDFYDPDTDPLDIAYKKHYQLKN
jgi:YgiT-type zinc finger domain-containing protein